MKKLGLIAIIISSIGLSSGVYGQESASTNKIKATVADSKDFDKVKKNFEKKTNIKIDEVNATPIAGVYELVKDGEIIYSTMEADYLIQGNIVNTATKKSITAERLLEISKVVVSELPLEQAIKIVNGDGKRVLYTFEDPNCGFCKKLAAQSISKMENVTVYTFAVGILGADSVAKSKKIMCSADPSKAWNEWMLKGIEPKGSESCDKAKYVEKNAQLAQKYKINGTPAIVFMDGSRFGGYLSKEDLENKLKSVKR